MVLDVLQAFTEFIEVPKKEWLHYTPPPQVVEVTQVEADVPIVGPIEMQPYNDPLSYPMAAARHIRAQHLAEQKEEERKVKAVELKVSNEELTHEAPNEESEVTKEGILAMFAQCNVVDLDSEASQFVDGMVKATCAGKPVLPCTFGGSSYYGLCDIGTTINVIPLRFYYGIQDELEHSQLQDTYMTIMLADKTLRVPM
jgi:hypothetical protein